MLYTYYCANSKWSDLPNCRQEAGWIQLQTSQLIKIFEGPEI